MLYDQAASRNMATQLIGALIKAFPSGLRLRDKNSQIPLHLAVMRKIDLDKMDLLLQRSPDAVLETDKYGFNCLNYAVEYDAPLDVFQLLLSANVACAAHCVKGKTVLHQAIEFKRSCPVIQAIVQAYPQAARMQEPIEGRLALHWAIERLLPLDVLECIDDANPKDGASVRSHKGWCSIHYAVHTPTPIEVVRRILRANPDIASDTTFPLHLDYQSQQQRLQQAAIAARANMVRSDSRMSRGRKRFPLNKYGGEVGAVHDGEDDAFESDRFVQKHSTIGGGSEAAAAAVVDDIEGGSIVTKFMLLHYASMHRKTLYETIGEILLLTMPYSVDGQFRKDHEDTWAYILGECGDAYWQSIDYVLTRYEHDQSLVRTLSEFTDKLVRKAIDIATPKSLYQIVRRLHYCSRFEMGHGQLHKSQYCMLFCATDHDVKLKRKAAVVLKFSKNRTTFMRDISVREMVPLSDQFVVPLLQHYNAHSDDKYRAELVRNQFEDYPYLSVFKAGEKDLLSIISHEYLAGGRNEGLIRQCCVELMRAVHHLHDKGIVHGSLKRESL
jgi:ankyrin repeat protein